jgi:hypothetical protein
MVPLPEPDAVGLQLAGLAAPKCFLHTGRSSPAFYEALTSGPRAPLSKGVRITIKERGKKSRSSDFN